VIDLKDGDRVERRGRGWVVADGQGYMLADIQRNRWDDDEGAEETPPLTFGTPHEALAAFLQAEAIGRATAERRRAVLERLGRA
jgi:hypothetical protein